MADSGAFDVARAEVTRRIGDVNPHSIEIPLADVIGTHIDRLTPEQLSQWEEWQQIRSSPIAKMERAAALVAGLSAPLLIWFGLAAEAGQESVRSIVGVIGAVAALSLLVVALLEADMSRRPGYLRWSVRTRLQSQICERVCVQPLRDSIEREIDYRTQATEARLVIVAAGIVRSVRLSPIWRARYLDRAHCRHDLEGELALVSRAAVDLHRHRTAASPQQATCNDRYYQEVWSALITRVAWLYCYELQLVQLARQPNVARGCIDLPNDEFSPEAQIVDEIRWFVTVLRETP